MGQLMPLAKLCTFSHDCFRHWGNISVHYKHKDCFCLLVSNKKCRWNFGGHLVWIVFPMLHVKYKQNTFPFLYVSSNSFTNILCLSVLYLLTIHSAVNY